MLQFISDPRQWAKRTFKQSDLGDKKRTRRLVDYAGRQAENIALSTNAACARDKAAIKGAYYLLENDRVTTEQILSGPTKLTAELCEQLECVVALEDSTQFDFYKEVEVKELKNRGKSKDAPKEKVLTRRIHMHWVLAVDAKTQQPLGPLHLELWRREKKEQKASQSKAQKREELRKKPYNQKESFKWQRASEQVVKVLGASHRVISVCDRESDIFEYIGYKREQDQRFVVRAAKDRKLEGSDKLLFQELAESPLLGTVEVHVLQYGNSPARTATLTVRGKEVTLIRGNHHYKYRTPQKVWALYVVEENPPEGVKALNWKLLTSEKLETLEEALEVIKYYKCRMLIEEYHQVGKTGARIEERKLEDGNIERLITILMVVAVRVLQLRALSNLDEKSPCDRVLSEDEWKVLWFEEQKHEAEKNRKQGKKQRRRCLPQKHPPTIRWAMEAIARLGGWTDSKKTGKIGWVALWRGWKRLQNMAEGYKIALEMMT